jgi:ribosomal protein S27AE
MPEAKFQIKRKCEVCGNTFIAKTLDSRYCCRHCTDIAYKKRKAAKAKEEQLNLIAQHIPSERDFISVICHQQGYHLSSDTQRPTTLYKYWGKAHPHFSQAVGKDSAFT